MILKLNNIEKAAFLLIIVSGLNWGLAGFVGLDLIRLILNIIPIVAKTVYALVNLSAIFLLYEVLKPAKDKVLKSAKD